MESGLCDEAALASRPDRQVDIGLIGTRLSLFATTLTGTAYDWVRARSGSTAAALMQGVYNLAISSFAAL